MANLLKTIAVRGLPLIAALGCLGLDTALAAPERRALLIGINEYASPKVVDLRGAVNDVKMLRRILVSRFGFDEQNITVLVDEQATRSALPDAMTASTIPGVQPSVCAAAASGTPARSKSAR